jgi:GNAT superfamily N-acetyltransferase
MRSTDLELYDEMTPAAFHLIGDRSGGSVEQRDGVVLMRGPHPDCILFNAACRIDRSRSPGDVLRLVRDHYEPEGFRFMLWTYAHHDEDLEAAAAKERWSREDQPIMVTHDYVGRPSIEPGVALRSVETAVDRQSFGSIVGATFAEDEAEADAYRRSMLASGLYVDGMTGVLASVDGTDAACAMVGVVGPAATVGFVATLPPFRRRGLGELVTAAVTNAALDLGAKLVTLQASEMGRPIYERMGYESISTQSVWTPPTANA